MFRWLLVAFLYLLSLCASAKEFDQRVAVDLRVIPLIEQLSDAEIEALADPLDDDRDGISGRVHRSFSLFEFAPAPGRFGWKATKPRLEDQILESFTNDLEIPSDDQNAVSELAKFIRSTIRIPRQRPHPPAPFHQAGCSNCHVWNGGLMSDLLLHDLGAALADGRAEGLARAEEWRTAPLAFLQSRDCFLHDCRAKTIGDAILLHDGEASAARAAYQRMSVPEQDLLQDYFIHHQSDAPSP